MSKKVLVVDDEEDIVHLIGSMLQKQGYEVLTACDGIKALETIKAVAPDLVIADLTMPNMNGWRLSTEIRRDRRFQSLPIIILSALIENEHPPEKFETADYYMVKPFDIFKLMDKVRELLNPPAS